MNNTPTLFVLSDNRDFIETLSHLVTQELAVKCQFISSQSEIKDLENAILIADRAVDENSGLPTITVALPVRLNVLLSDIQALLSDMTMVAFLDIASDYRLSLQEKQLMQISTGQHVDVTDKESKLLQLMSQAGSAGVSRDILLKEVWGIHTELDTHTMETHIYRLRKKIKDGFDVEMIKASDGGYVL